MQHDPRKYLWDARTAADAVSRYVRGKTLDDYSSDDFLRSAVERQLQNVGEAISQLGRNDPQMVQHIPQFREIVAFRNVLVHGYAVLDHASCGAWCNKMCRNSWPL